MKAMRTNLCLGLFAVLMGFGAVSGNVSAQTVAPPQADTSSATPENAVLLTVFLKHDQLSKFFCPPSQDYREIGL
jgi:hypothetical protein